MTEPFFVVVQRAVADISEAGFDSEGRVAFWMEELRKSANTYLMSEQEMTERLRDALGAIYSRLIDKGQIARYHSNIGRFTVEKLKPHLRAELDRRILASADLIKLNRQESIDATLRRFQGWSTSIPAGGSKATDKRDTAATIKKSMQSMPFEARRVIIDQGHKLTAAINEIVASDGGAIAARWRSHAGELNYNARPDHAKRNNHVFLIRDSWAQKAGLVKVGKDGYTDQIEQPAEFVYCRCFYVYLYAVSDLPDDMVTEKGRAELARVRKEMATA